MNIEKFCEKYGFGKVINITKITGGLMHKMFKIETDKGAYCVKVLNPKVMPRKEAYGNFVVSEPVSNLAKKNGIPVPSALNIEGNYLTKLDDMYYMVFDYVEGKSLKDDEITVEYCKKIGNVLAHIHSLDYKEIGLEPNVVEYKRLYDWECAGVANPERELLEDALCWSGFLSNNFSEEKFIAILKEYF